MRNKITTLKILVKEQGRTHRQALLQRLKLEPISPKQEIMYEDYDDLDLNESGIHYKGTLRRGVERMSLLKILIF